MFQMRMLQVAAAVAVLGVWGCGGGGMSRAGILRSSGRAPGRHVGRCRGRSGAGYAGAGRTAAGPAAARLDEGIGG